jgi:hypothetical protein
MVVHQVSFFTNFVNRKILSEIPVWLPAGFSLVYLKSVKVSKHIYESSEKIQ